MLAFLASASAGGDCPGCRATLVQTKHGDRKCEAGTDFGCYPGEDQMWVRRESGCGGFFDCNDGHAAVRCGSRYMRPIKGEERANCSCAPRAAPRPRRRRPSQHHRSGTCGAHADVDGTGGVSERYRKLPQPAGSDPSVKCCRNKATFGGPIDHNVTLGFTAAGRGVAPWPEDCEPLCTHHESGRCRFFSHSFVWQSCIFCATCDVPEIMIGDGSQSSYQLASEDPARLYTGCNSKESCAEAAVAAGLEPPSARGGRRRGRRTRALSRRRRTRALN